MSRLGCLAFTLLVGAGAVVWFRMGGERTVPPGIAVSETPIQGNVPDGASVVRIGSFVVSPLAGYKIRARVLGRENYYVDGGAKLAPVDLALGWGRMSDPMVYHALNIHQRGRYYFYSWGAGGPPIPRQEIITHSANNHLIPANSQIASTLKSTRIGDIVDLKGSLVEVNGQDGYHWRSSLTREDTGGGSCELMYVTDASIEPPTN